MAVTAKPSATFSSVRYGRTDELFGIGAGLALEAAAEAIGIVLECAALCGDGAFAILDSALSDG
jgi:hypothetical protein